MQPRAAPLECAGETHPFFSTVSKPLAPESLDCSCWPLLSFWVGHVHGTRWMFWGGREGLATRAIEVSAQRAHGVRQG